MKSNSTNFEKYEEWENLSNIDLVLQVRECVDTLWE